MNIATLLKTIQILIHNPNPDDGLVLEITDQYRRDLGGFQQTAKQWTLKYATTTNQTSSNSSRTLTTTTNITTTNTDNIFEISTTKAMPLTVKNQNSINDNTTNATNTTSSNNNNNNNNNSVLGVRSSAFADDNSEEEEENRNQSLKKHKLN